MSAGKAPAPQTLAEISVVTQRDNKGRAVTTGQRLAELAALDAELDTTGGLSIIRDDDFSAHLHVVAAITRLAQQDDVDDEDLTNIIIRVDEVLRSLPPG